MIFNVGRVRQIQKSVKSLTRRIEKFFVSFLENSKGKSFLVLFFFSKEKEKRTAKVRRSTVWIRIRTEFHREDETFFPVRSGKSSRNIFGDKLTAPILVRSANLRLEKKRNQQSETI